MGGGNAQKSATARARKLKEEGSKKGSQLKVNSAAKNIMCQICRQTFLCTAQLNTLQEHASSKHSKSTFEACFPNHAK